MARPHVLLVDDSPDDEALFLRALARAGIDARVSVARDGDDALDRLLGRGARPDDTRPTVVLLDLKMPRVDGFGVLRRLRADAGTRGLPVVVFTSSNEPRDVAEAYRLGASGYVRKPVDSDAYTQAVRRISRYWLELNEPLPSAPDGPVTRFAY